jgi:DMSO reductase anchor subunit
MHPAYSVIIFTTASGAGYGLLVWLALAKAFELAPAQRSFAVVAFGLAFVLITAGLLSSTAHLGRPERAWRAFSQWRTSWLSREGVLALATYLPSGFLALGWASLARTSAVALLLVLATIASALMTLFSTGMIYASLRTIRQWHQPLTAPIYLALGLASGAVLLNLLLRAFGPTQPWSAWLALACVAVAGLLKWAYWRAIDAELRTYTVEAATGLGHLGKVRPLEPPHTEPNYIMREMGYRVARKHAKALRRGVGIFAFAVPMAISLLSLFPTPTAAFGPALGLVGSAIAVLALAAGLLLERWLFFAEAEHVVMLYYGADVA